MTLIMTRRFRRKAVSAIIATFMLVVITLTIGVLVVSLGRNYITKGKTDVTLSKTDLRCGTDVGIAVPEIAGAYKLCKDNSTAPNSINFTIQNIGSITIDDLQVKIYSSKGLKENTTLLSEPLKQGANRQVSMSYDSTTVGAITQINIVPRIKKPGQIEALFCEESQLVFKELPEC